MEAVTFLLKHPLEFVSQIKQDVSSSIFNLMTRINKSKTWVKHLLYECKSKLDGERRNSD